MQTSSTPPAYVSSTGVTYSIGVEGGLISAAAKGLINEGDSVCKSTFILVTTVCI